MKKNKVKWLKRCGYGFLVLTVVLSFTVGCSVGKTTERQNVEKKAETIEKLIDTYYLDKKDEKQIDENVYKGIVNGLGDKYSEYFTAEEYKKQMESSAGMYSGIGVVVSQNPDTKIITVVNPYENGPGYEAGIRAGDILYKVDDKDITSEAIDNVVTKIRGAEGTKVKITVYRNSEELSFEVKRGQVEVPTVDHKMLDDKIGYIQVSGFEKVTVDQFNKALTDLEKKDEKGLIIDLRDNPGGLLTSVVSMLQEILPKGKIVYTKDKNGEGETFTCDGTKEFKKPLVLLVNGNSASASEIFAGAVKDYKIGTLVGTKTFGKGIVQQVFPMSDGSAVKLTVSKYYTPNGSNIHGKGIEPDVEEELSAETKALKKYDINKDNQVQKGISIIKEKLK